MFALEWKYGCRVGAYVDFALVVMCGYDAVACRCVMIVDARVWGSKFAYELWGRGKTRGGKVGDISKSRWEV